MVDHWNGLISLFLLTLLIRSLYSQSKFMYENFVTISSIPLATSNATSDLAERKLENCLEQQHQDQNIGDNVSETINVREPTVSNSSVRLKTVQAGPTASNHVHVLYALSGNASGFLHEFDVSLKSVLLNAPIHSNLTIHVMADDLPYKSLPQILNQTNISSWNTLNCIQLQAYNVERYKSKWKKIIPRTLNVPFARAVSTHTIGTYFRLFAHQVIDTNDVNNFILYMDTDVVIMASLDNLWKHATKESNRDKLFLWGQREQCAGFALLNFRKMDRIWETAASLDLKAMAKPLNQKPNDQLILKAINSKFPELVGGLPPEWDVTVAGDTPLYKRNLTKVRPSVGMLHLNGGGASKDSAFLVSPFIKNKRFQSTWGHAEYFVHMPWSWAKFKAESLVIESEKSYPLAIRFDQGVKSSQ